MRQGAADGSEPPARPLTGCQARLAAAEQRIAELEDALAARDDFVAVVAHELRNPIVPILLSVDRARRLAKAGDLARLRQTLDLLDRAVAAFARRAVQLLDVSRFNAGEFRLTPEPSDFSALMQAVAAGLAEMARHAGCVLRTEIEPGITGCLDREAVRQVVENLLVNALKYGAGRPVELIAHRDGGEVCVIVRDHGPGIAEADRQRIFERFERVARRGSPSGFGIGLWVVGQLVAAMRGTITVNSAADQGATFTVRLPVAEGGGS